MNPLKLMFVVAVLVLAVPAVGGADTPDRLFLDAAVAAIADSSYTGDDLGGASSVAEGRNYTLTCREYRTALLSNEPQLEGMAVGLSLGVSDMLAQLHCFVGDDRCRCLRDWPVGNPAAFGEVVGREIATCQRDRPAAGAVQQAVMRACR